MPPGIDTLAELVDQRTEGRFRAKVEAAAAAFGFDWRPVMLANASYELVVAGFGCSTAILAGEHCPVLFRNMDWWPEDLLARSSVIVAHGDGGEVRYETSAGPGAAGAVTGMSHRGFAVALNAVSVTAQAVAARPSLRSFVSAEEFVGPGQQRGRSHGGSRTPPSAQEGPRRHALPARTSVPCRCREGASLRVPAHESGEPARASLLRI